MFQMPVINYVYNFKDFYKPGGGYNRFAGYDCSVNLATMKFD